MHPKSTPQRRPTTKTGSGDGPPYLWAGLAALAIGILYAVTLSPSTAFWDASEYIATAHILGIPHPPGNPLFVVVARTWEILLSPFGLSSAVRINLFSALALASVTTYAVLGLGSCPGASPRTKSSSVGSGHPHDALHRPVALVFYMQHRAR